MKNVYEILDDFVNAPTRAEKIEVLRKNGQFVLKSVLQGAYHPAIKFVIKKKPAYNISDAPPGLGYSNMDQELKRVYLFVENSPKVDRNLTYERKEQILIQILEALEAKEAEVFMNMLLKDLKVKGLTPKIIEEAFPGLLS
jgi:hypothetical protein